MTPSRRFFLQGSTAAIAAAATTGLTGAMAGLHAQTATSGEDYKALVCVFLLGGLDNHELLIPYDQSSYNGWLTYRQGLTSTSGGAHDRSGLLPLSPANASQFNGREFAMLPTMSGVQGLFNQGQASVVANVGPLIVPTTAAQAENNAVQLPPRLFSHNDQQITWQASSPEGAQYGWGGRFADATATSANTGLEFSTITALGNDVFLTGENVQPYQVGLDGAPALDPVLQYEDSFPGVASSLAEHFRSSQFLGSNLIEQDMANKGRDGYDANVLYNQASGSAASLTTAFPATPLSQQLQAVARTISIRQSLGVTRQIFFVGMGGFDTHSNQATTLPNLLGAVDGAITSFQAAMVELGLNDNVTLFTASDFGRSLVLNDDGTDHGWGGHSLVVGGAVQGNQIIGDVPESALNHAQDAGNGRLVPTTSVEQLAAPLGRWFGLNDNQLALSLPNLGNFASTPELSLLG